MSAFDTVHVIGSTIYIFYSILFAWLSRIPRTPPGTGWWALATFCAFGSRLWFLFVPANADPLLFEAGYAILIILEKTLLMVGIHRFFGQEKSLGPFLAFCALTLVWVPISNFISASTLVFGLFFGAFNVVVLFRVAWITFTSRAEGPTQTLIATAFFSLVLGLHWSTYPFLRFSTGYRVPGFFLGTCLVLLLYLSLLVALLLIFQKRLEDAEQHALNLAYHDPLTGLKNKRYMNALFDNALILATRPHQKVAVCYVDLDHFKPINDSAGHHIGDEVLKEVASRLIQSTRSTDICSRIGGDEFVVIATQLENEAHIQKIATKLLEKLAQPIRVEGKVFRLGASIGISLYPVHGSDLTALLECADEAMYRVKQSGRNGFQIYQSPENVPMPDAT